MRVFEYTDIEMCYLSSRDSKLANVIEAAGHIERETDADVFSSIVHQIIAQQISNKAQEAVWNRVQGALGAVTAQSVAKAGEDTLKGLGLSSNKARYVMGAAKKVLNGEFNPQALEDMTDEKARSCLTAIKGVGEWTADMVLLFGLQRPNVLSRKDAGILRGMEIVYGNKADDALFERVKSALSPYCSVASLYFWHVAGGFDVVSLQSKSKSDIITADVG